LKDGVPAVFPRSLLDEWLRFLEEEGIKLGKTTPRAITEDGLWRWILEHRLLLKGPVAGQGSPVAAQDPMQSAPAAMPKQPQTVSGNLCPDCGSALLKVGRQYLCLKEMKNVKVEARIHEKRHVKIPNEEEGERILEHIGRVAPDDWPIAWLMLKRGMRIGEVVSSHRGTSNLPGLRIKDLGQRSIWIEGKKGHRDEWPVPDEIIARLRQLIGNRADPEERIFYAGYKTPRQAFLNRFKHYCQDAGIDGWQHISPHKLRHAFGYASAKATGGDIFKVANLLRHKGTATAGTYVHGISSDEKTKLLNTIAGVPSNAEPPKVVRAEKIVPQPPPLPTISPTPATEKPPVEPSHHEDHKPAEPVYRMKPAPSPDSPPSARTPKTEPELPPLPSTKPVDVVTGPPRNPRAPVERGKNEWACPFCDAPPTWTPYAMEQHIERRHPLPSKGKLESWT